MIDIGKWIVYFSIVVAVTSFILYIEFWKGVDNFILGDGMIKLEFYNSILFFV